MTTSKGISIEDYSIEDKISDFITAHRVGRLATADGSGAPHVIPICYVFDGTSVYTALDLKPKRVEGRQLKRVRNILENPNVALVIDDYSEDWSQLAYVLIQGQAALVEARDEQERAEAMLREKYPQYQELLEEGCTIIRISPQKVISWGDV